MLTKPHRALPKRKADYLWQIERIRRESARQNAADLFDDLRKTFAGMPIAKHLEWNIPTTLERIN